MEKQQTNAVPRQRGVEHINERAVRLDSLSVEELEVLHGGCTRRLHRARTELAVVEDVLEERRNPAEDLGLTL